MRRLEDRDVMGGLSKGLHVIEAFRADRPRLSITDVAAASGLDRATARRCLLTLARDGYADYDGKYFTLTPRVLRLGTACLATMPLPQLVQPLLDRLSEQIGESTSVSMLDDTEIVYVARAAQRKVMSITLMPGSRLPAYCTSMGRVLLAGLSEADAVECLGPGTLPARTPYTLTEPVAILAVLRRVRTDGFCVVDEEVELGLRSIAVPLLDVRGRLIAALNVGLAAGRADAAHMPGRFLPAMKVVQAELARVLR